MDIKIKRRSDRKNEPIAVIEFKDKKDADLFFMGMKDYLDFEYMPRAVRDIIETNVEKIKKRCDDKYAHPGCALSAFLYSDEFEMLVLAFLMEASYKYSGTTLQCDDKLSDIEENNSLKNNTENN